MKRGQKGYYFHEEDGAFDFVLLRWAGCLCRLHKPTRADVTVLISYYWQIGGMNAQFPLDLLGQQNTDTLMIGFVPLNEKDRKFIKKKDRKFPQHSLEWNPDKDFRRNSARTLIRRQQHKTKKKSKS